MNKCLFNNAILIANILPKFWVLYYFHKTPGQGILKSSSGVTWYHRPSQAAVCDKLQLFRQQEAREKQALQ